MTFKERLAKEHPQYVNKAFGGGCLSCPSVYGYEAARPAECDDNTFFCDDCWNREIPEQENI